MNTNYRVMNTPSEKQGLDYYQIVEVVYDNNGKEVDYAMPTLAANNPTMLLTLLDDLVLAFEYPLLHEKTFRQ